jgi:hypothetical protein
LGTFFLFLGTALFLGGLGCLLAVFISTLARLKAHRVTSIYFRKRPSIKKWLPAAIGVLLVILSQGAYWFRNEVEKFVPFDDTIPQMRLSFVIEQDRTPRVEITTQDQKSQFNSQMVPLKGTRLFITSEVIQWDKAFQLLGLRDCYHFDGVYYIDADSLNVYEQPDPDYELYAGPTKLVALIRALESVFPAKAKIMVSPPIEVDPERRYVLKVSPDSLSQLQPFDNVQAAEDYSP